MIPACATNFAGWAFLVGLLLAYVGILAYLQARTERLRTEAYADEKMNEMHRIREATRAERVIWE